MKKKWMAVLLSVVTMASVLGGCGQDNNNSNSNVAGNKENEEPYEATLMYWVANDARDVEAVEEAFNELTMEQLNMKVDLTPVTLGTYSQQIQMILSSDDKLDIFPYWSDNMGTYIDADYLVDMNEYLDDYGQGLIQTIGKEDIMCCSMDGFLGAVPSMHERTNPVYMVMRTDLLDESGFQAEDIHSLEDMTKVYEKVKELHPDMIMYGGVNTMTYPIIVINSVLDALGGNTFGVLMDQGQTTTVTNWYESEEFMSACKTMREWNQSGYTSADLATCSDGGESLMRAGNLFSFTTWGKPNTKAEKDAITGYDTTCVQITPDACYTKVTNSVCYGISSNSEDPAKAMTLLNWIYTTKEANDLLNWGVENKDYVLTEDGTIDYPEGVTSENVSYHQDFGWAQMNQYNSYVWTGNSPDLWDQYQKVRDNATVSKAYGFFFDPSNVLNETAAIQTVSDEYLTSLSSGSVDPEKVIPEFNEKLYQAGLQKVIEEKQAQLDTWLEQQ